MTPNTHHTAPTQYVTTGLIRFAYRRFGKTQGVPVVFLMHFTGTMDYWDPAVTDAIAQEREVILFDNAGVASSSGSVPTTMEAMAVHAAAFVRALGLAHVDVLGFSIGGFVGQALALAEPDLCRRLVLVGTGPRGGEGMATLSPEAQAIFAEPRKEPDAVWLKLFFAPSESSQQAGRAFLERFRLRTAGRDPEMTKEAIASQLLAINEWGLPHPDGFAYLREISQPTLVVNGGSDIVIYTLNSFTLQQHIPDAQLILYPDSNHGAQYQYPELFARHVSMFLDG